MKLWQAIHRWWNELRIQALILFRLGKEELALYRRERTLIDKTIWVPKGREWARARILRKGQKRLVVSFIDHGGIGAERRSVSGREIPAGSAQTSRSLILATQATSRSSNVLFPPERMA